MAGPHIYLGRPTLGCMRCVRRLSLSVDPTREREGFTWLDLASCPDHEQRTSSSVSGAEQSSDALSVRASNQVLGSRSAESSPLHKFGGGRAILIRSTFVHNQWLRSAMLYTDSSSLKLSCSMEDVLLPCPCSQSTRTGRESASMPHLRSTRLVNAWSETCLASHIVRTQ